MLVLVGAKCDHLAVLLGDVKTKDNEQPYLNRVVTFHKMYHYIQHEFLMKLKIVCFLTFKKKANLA